MSIEERYEGDLVEGELEIDHRAIVVLNPQGHLRLV
jgi:hypothetical protein